MTRRMLGLALTVAVGLVSCAGDPPDVSPDDAVLVAGRGIYADRCVSCHGANGQGGTGSRLNQGNIVGKYPTPEDQAALMRAGRKNMPSFASLSGDDLDAVIRYTREIINEQG